MTFHENRLPIDDIREISCLIYYFWKRSKIWNCRLLQIVGGALRVSAHADVSSGTRDLNSSLILYLHSLFVHANSEGSGEPVNLHWFALAFVAWQSTKSSRAGSDMHCNSRVTKIAKAKISEFQFLIMNGAYNKNAGKSVTWCII